MKKELFYPHDWKTWVIAVDNDFSQRLQVHGDVLVCKDASNKGGDWMEGLM